MRRRFAAWGESAPALDRRRTQECCLHNGPPRPGHEVKSIATACCGGAIADMTNSCQILRLWEHECGRQYG